MTAITIRINTEDCMNDTNNKKNYIEDLDPIPIPRPPGSFLPLSPGADMVYEELQGNSSLANTSKVQSSDQDQYRQDDLMNTYDIPNSPMSNAETEFCKKLRHILPAQFTSDLRPVGVISLPFSLSSFTTIWFTQQQPALSINSFNVHRLLITGVMVAAKFMDDLYYNNAYYAKVGGISTTEMNFLEVDFLFGLGFQLNINPTTFHTYCSYLQREMLLLQPPLDHHHLIPSPTSSSSSSSYKSLSTKLLHYEEEHQPQQEVAAL
ncbi:cyclin-U4-1-like protein [Tanacetum coccineum]|uniref:Cyclin-U4-1-like protein n=1 Tax=Tanacetum coccineum TaxID=301880 RepID=A0ABQ5D0U3_9ASTR